MNFRGYDLAPEDELNRILWRVAKGPDVPYPTPIHRALFIDAPAHSAFAGDLIAIAQAGRGRVCAARYMWLTDRWQPVVDSTRILDALDGATTITPFYTPQDVPGELMSLAMYRHALPFTTKPLQGPGVQYGAEMKYALKMAEVIGDPKEVLTIALSPVSPLTIPDHEAKAMMEIAKSGVAFGALPCPTAGATSPMSISGSIAQQNAETLAVVVLTQLVNP